MAGFERMLGQNVVYKQHCLALWAHTSPEYFGILDLEDKLSQSTYARNELNLLLRTVPKICGVPVFFALPLYKA